MATVEARRRKGGNMSVAKVIEISSESERGFEDAVLRGVKKAGETVKNMRSVWIKDQEMLLNNGEINGYRVKLKITFALDS
jgi:hypothetical protein